jgi:hypothetical protein
VGQLGFTYHLLKNSWVEAEIKFYHMTLTINSKHIAPEYYLSREIVISGIAALSEILAESLILDDQTVVWLDYLIDLYNVPYSSIMYVSPKTSYMDIIIGRAKSYSLYWENITDFVFSQTTKNAGAKYLFIEKYFAELNWVKENIYRYIDEKFIRSHKMLWLIFNWNHILIKVNLSEKFLEKLINVELMFKSKDKETECVKSNINKDKGKSESESEKDKIKQKLRGINFTYMFSNQILTKVFLEKYLLSSGALNNPTNWDMVMKSPKCSPSFKEEYRASYNNSNALYDQLREQKLKELTLRGF